MSTGWLLEQGVDVVFSERWLGYVEGPRNPADAMQQVRGEGLGDVGDPVADDGGRIKDPPLDADLGAEGAARSRLGRSAAIVI